MKKILILLILSVAFYGTVFAAATLNEQAAPVAVASCDKPLENYKCYDTAAASYCQGVNLFYLRGYCPGGNNIQCCAPKGFPEGPRVNGPGITNYGSCDSPKSGYRCYDINEISSCPNPLLQFVRGWCNGPNEIQCCAPAGTPEGTRVGGSGVEVLIEPGTQTQDFWQFIEGTLSCEYTVKSGNRDPVKRSVPCDSSVLIKVGPGEGNDCRDEGPGACVIINDGGYLGATKTFTFSIKFVKPAKTYGACDKYPEFQCVAEADCKATGGTPLKGYCPGKPDKIKCCVYQAAYVSQEPTSSYVFDSTKGKTLNDISGLNAQLREIHQSYNAKIIIELLEGLTANEEKDLRNKYHFKYKLDESGAKLTALITYVKSKNTWLIIEPEKCGIGEAFSEMTKNPGVEENINAKNYDEAFKSFVDLLKDTISKRSAAGDVCRKAASEGSCQKQCDSTLFGLGGCSQEKCVNMDGCIWNSGRCEDICPGENAVEAVIIKRGECENAKTCHDVYVCRNGKIVEGPARAAFSTVPAALGVSATGDCSGVPSSFLQGYENYKGHISSAIRSSNLGIYVSNPEALVAAVISQESGWDKSSFNPNDPSYGLMGIVAALHPKCDASKIKSFDATENINCGVGYLADIASEHDLTSEKTYACKGLRYSGTDAMLRYYNGWPPGTVSGKENPKVCNGDPNYVEKINKFYLEWQRCLKNDAPSGALNDEPKLPEGTFKISEMAKISGSRYLDPRGNEFSPSCSLSGIEGYWMKLYSSEGALDDCTGMHGAPAGNCEPSVDNQKLGRIFSSVAPGASVTIKDPYGAGNAENKIPAVADKNTKCSEACRSADPDLVSGRCESAPGDFSSAGRSCDTGEYCNCYRSAPTGQAVAMTGYASKPLDELSFCKLVCSNPLDSLKGIFGASDCKKLCLQQGCSWIDNKCKAHSTLCLTHDIDKKKKTDTGVRDVLFVPVFDIYEGTPIPGYFSFSLYVNNQLSSFLNALPEKCRNKFNAKIPTREEFDSFEKGICPTDPKVLRELAAKYGYNPADYDIIVGVGHLYDEEHAVGSTNCLARETREVTDLGKGLIWVSTLYDQSLAHEIGHLFGLDDQYCSQEAGGFLRCNGPNSINRLSPSLGCDPVASSGPNVCCGSGASYEGNPLRGCKDAGYGVCCLGNKVGDGRSIMSSASFVAKGFDPNELKQITTVLGCSESASTDSSAISENNLIARLEKAIQSKHGQQFSQLSFSISSSLSGKSYARQWAETIVGHLKSKTPENAALITAIIEKETKGEFSPDPNLDIAESVTKAFGRADSLGCMQVQIQNAAEIAAENGRNSRNVQTDLRTMDGCVFYGSSYLNKIIDIYAKYVDINTKNVPIIASAYNAPIYSPRNAAFQRLINFIAYERKLGINSILEDGFLISSPPPSLQNPGQTEKALEILLSKSLTNNQIRSDLSFSDSKNFENTATYAEIQKMGEKFAEYAMVPQFRASADIYHFWKPEYWHPKNVPQYAKDILRNYKEYCAILGCEEFT